MTINGMLAPEHTAEILPFPIAKISNTQDLVQEGATNVVLNGEEAPNIMQLPEGAEAVKFGTFEAFAAAIMDSNNPTYAMPKA